jgi:hypothetical protein
MSLILSGTDGLSDVDGSASTPAIRGTDTNTGIFFPAADTIAFAEGGAECARFDSSGNFGIGNTNPAQKLDVKGPQNSVQARFGSIAGRGLTIGTSAVSGTNEAGAVFNAPVTGGTLIFQTESTERMRIDSSGNLLVGTTSTVESAKLTVSNVGGTGFCSVVNASGSGAVITSENFSNTCTAISFRTNFGAVGSITCGSSTAYNTSSDYRLKENIAPMTGALSTVSALKPVTYTWKADGSSGEGFIAHELAEVCPDAVTGEKDAVNEDGSIKPQGIDTSFLVATLTAAIQELKAELDGVKAELATLKA